MAYRIRAQSTDNSVLEDVNEIPDTCAACGKGISPIFCYQYSVDVWRAYDGFLQIVFRCPRKECQRLFVALYGAERGYAGAVLILRRTYLMDFVEFEKFPESVSSISSQFEVIYNQSKIADENGLHLIAGPGYRKALEFLVKDYLIRSDPQNEETIKKEQLGAAIKRIKEKRIEACASRAAWLGNDETHYIRKWEDKDLQDLKNLIKMVVDWIDLVERSDEYEAAMPSPESPAE